jgi:hypothetical protein
MVFWIHDRKFTSSSNEPNERQVDIRIVTFLLALTALVSPFAINVYSHEVYDWLFSLTGMIWTMVNMNLRDIIIDHVIFIIGLPFTCLRLVFAYLIHRYLLGRTTRKRAIIMGLLSELQAVLITLPIITFLLLIGTPDIVGGFFIPIPVLLLVGLVIILVVSVSEIESPW